MFKLKMCGLITGIIISLFLIISTSFFLAIQRKKSKNWNCFNPPKEFVHRGRTVNY